MNHKGKAETVEIKTEELMAGDHVNLEIGDWNGSGYSYQANGNAKVSVYVIETFEDHMVCVFTNDRVDWAMDGDESLEFTVHRNGFVNGVDFRFNNPRAKDYENVESRGGYHKVVHGIEKTRGE